MIYTWHYGSFYTKEYFCKGNKCLLGTNRLEAARLWWHNPPLSVFLLSACLKKTKKQKNKNQVNHSPAYTSDLWQNQKGQKLCCTIDLSWGVLFISKASLLRANMPVFCSCTNSDATVTCNNCVDTWIVQFRDGNELPNAQWPISIRVTHCVDYIFEHDQQWVWCWRFSHEVFNSTTKNKKKQIKTALK